jgi:dCMP deaminase
MIPGERCDCGGDCSCVNPSQPAGAKPPLVADKWDVRFLEMADFISHWSKDPSTKTGAVIVRPDRTICSVGYNGFPRGMKDDADLYANREVKYSRVIHCEINAVFSASEKVDGYTLYTTGPSCERCAVHMIQAGIKRFVYWAPLPEQVVRWNVGRTLGYFQEAGVEYLEIIKV